MKNSQIRRGAWGVVLSSMLFLSACAGKGVQSDLGNEKSGGDKAKGAVVSGPCEAYQADLTRQEEKIAELRVLLSRARNAAERQRITRAIITLERERDRTRLLVAKCMSSKKPGVDGVEFTQGVQYFHSLFDPNSPSDAARPRPDNFFPMVAGKDTGVRLYPRASSVLREYLSKLPSHQFYGKVSFAFTKPDGTVEQVAIDSLNPAQIQAPGAEIDRGKLEQTLNFVIPEKYCSGSLALQFEISVAQGEGLAPFSTQTRSETLRFEKLPAFEVLMIRVEGVDASGSRTAAPVSDDRFTYAWDLVKKYFPVGEAHVQFADFKSQYYYDAEDFLRLEGANLRALRASHRNAVGIAILPYSPPGGAGIRPGIGKPSLRVFAVFPNTVTEYNVAHELGHAVCGLMHYFDYDKLNATVTGRDKVVYPPYDTRYAPSHQNGAPLAPGSIGEFGWDTKTNKVFLPHALDFVTAGYIANGFHEGTWISAFHQEAMLRCFREKRWEKDFYNGNCGERESVEPQLRCGF